ncbi:MAG: glycerate kinase [Phycisphaerae bacterium]|nr:glycerate kinase [Phycisphaerae bacterium]
MRIIIAPDKFKDCLSAPEVAAAIADGIRRVDPAVEIDCIPLADGGEGTVAALVGATKGRLIRKTVTGPLPEMKVDATFGLLDAGQTAVIEMAAASGSALLQPADRNPMATTTFGTGELIRAAIESGANHIIVGLGGSATVDGGIGCAQACGHTIILEEGEPVSMTEPLTGADLSRIVMIKRHRGEATDRAKITIASDVTNPLCGPNGAARIFGPQKGATPAQALELDGALNQLAKRCNAQDIAQRPGAGAAGGLGFGLMAFFGAELHSGIELVMNAVRLRERLRGADLCITGEGRIDDQTAQGKTVAGVARLCRELHIPCIALAGAIGEGADACLDMGVTSYFGISDGPRSLEDAIRDARPLLSSLVSRIVRLIDR